MNENPKASLSAILSPGGLTLGKIALLCDLESPILMGKVDSIADTLVALYVIEQPLRDVLSHVKTVRAEAISFYDGLDTVEYGRKVASALDMVARFYEMLPRPEPDSKKNSATDGSPSSENGCAEPTATPSSMPSTNSRQSRPPCSGDAGHRVLVEAKRELS